MWNLIKASTKAITKIVFSIFFHKSFYSKIPISKLKLRYFTTTKSSRRSNRFHKIITPAEATVCRCSWYRCFEKRLQHWCFPVNIAKFLRNSLFTRTYPVAASGPAKMVFLHTINVFTSLVFNIQLKHVLNKPFGNELHHR